MTNLDKFIVGVMLGAMVWLQFSIWWELRRLRIHAQGTAASESGVCDSATCYDRACPTRHERDCVVIGGVPCDPFDIR